MPRPIYDGKRIRLKKNGKNVLWVKVRNVLKDDTLTVSRRSDNSLLATGKVLQPTVKNNGVTLPYAKLLLEVIRTAAPAPYQDEVIPVTITLTNSSGDVNIEDDIIIDDVDPTITRRKNANPKLAKVAAKPKASTPKKLPAKKSSPKSATKKATSKKKK
jgi:hypothetical protein